jgi:hypothetical protein
MLAVLVVWVAMLSPAYGATTIGSNFDSILSVIYDDTSGNVFLESSPLSNPSTQRLKIASTGGMLLPGNLSTPALVPAVTVTTATTSLIDIEWSAGNFLGTGSFIGNILAASIPVGTLLSDLTIDWAPASSSLTSGDLLYSTLGTTPGNPILPGSGADGFFRFFDVASGQFFDPPIADGFTYKMTSNSLFTKVGFPIGFGNDFRILVNNVVVASSLPADGAYMFAGAGVGEFTIRGIDPDVDAANPDAFPVYLEFDTDTASFDMTAVAVPFPAAAWLGLPVLGAMMWLRRRGN